MRCDRHDLALGPDGQCVLCRRASVAPAASTRSAAWIVGTFASIAIVSAAGAAYRLWPMRAAIPNVRVIVYTTTWCPVCKRAKQWLAANGYAYDERDIEASATNRIECKALNPRLSIPTFDVDGDVMIGFSSGQLVSMVEKAAKKRAAPL